MVSNLAPLPDAVAQAPSATAATAAPGHRGRHWPPRTSVGFLTLAPRMLLAGMITLSYLAQGLWDMWRLPPGDLRQRRAINRLHVHARPMIRLAGIHLRTAGQTQWDGHLVLGNHLSWVDPIVLAAWRPCVFVTSKEVEVDPVLGTFSKMAGCVFVERRAKRSVAGEQTVIADLLHRGFCVVIYAEATSSCGDSVMPFRSGLVGAAAGGAAGGVIQPVAMRYIGIDGQPFSPANRDRIAWYSKMPFFTHAAQLFLRKAIPTALVALAPIAMDGSGGRKAACLAAEVAVRRTYHRLEWRKKSRPVAK